MALNKTKPGKRGNSFCLLHCLLYTASVCLFLWTVNPLIVILVFLSHWPIDRWSLASKWEKLIGSRDIIAAFHSHDKYREVDLGFSILVYAVADNTIHLLLLWGIVQLLVHT